MYHFFLSSRNCMHLVTYLKKKKGEIRFRFVILETRASPYTRDKREMTRDLRTIHSLCLGREFVSSSGQRCPSLLPATSFDITFSSISLVSRYHLAGFTGEIESTEMSPLERKPLSFVKIHEIVAKARPAYDFS